jgi:hypothetical protein
VKLSVQVYGPDKAEPVNDIALLVAEQVEATTLGDLRKGCKEIQQRLDDQDYKVTAFGIMV